MNDVAIARSERHEHGVNVGFAEEGCWLDDSGRNADTCSLADLTLMASLNVPLDVRLEGRPPEAVKKCVASGIKATVPKIVMGLLDEGKMLLQQDVELMAAVLLQMPEMTARQ